MQEIMCVKPGYNTATAMVDVIAADTVYQEFTLTQPTMVISPLLINATVNPNEVYTTNISILNNGTGPLDWAATIDLLNAPYIPCTYSIVLYDAFGDGWNGCNLDVLVDGVVVLDNITITSGSGPATFYFDVVTGAEITTVFSPASWPCEPYYYIYDSEGNQVWYEPPYSGDCDPEVPAGALYGSCGGGAWLTMEYYNGTVPEFGGVNNIPTYLNASYTNAGEVYQGTITFTSTPNVGTIVVPVTMTVIGDPLMPPTDLEATLINDLTGEIYVTWNWGTRALQYFLIKRDGAIIGTTTNTFFTDFAPTYGTYCYTVQAIYDEGSTAPAGPVCVEWPKPEIFVDPMSLEGWVWVNHQVKVYTTIYNQDFGTLHYVFPDWVDADNMPGATISVPAGLNAISCLT